ncbi:MAG: transporter substrate-binding domain-containing protein [Roseofilum sp. SBFL]|uniref:transporter substrate-binding domain-containing protein n=1 Tax=unclassified Roseofilum TaxID=2620099 RepID=UPI001B15B676|nr:MULTISPECIES: transporter substrate-binding domain-containing protein [unclassified Roseofilum]MBP0013017.1 transporter substrate-binding domain-containing protein [Roseofilum sp. SID3]MBP0026296.1 transporter substrate-binding domain-containing protein [Roseofilum sp. SID2]MBP0039621.1 transporter substrate-binding domain-containing protein [Roseofilum sp. SID1]MBP0044188.1 transporter substrate-binding domain-containing protein [Roseofilum sp. SBFL]
MKSIKTFLILSITAFFSVLIFSACSQTPTSTTLVMGTSADYPPYEFKDSTGGEERIIGFDVDIAQSLAKSLNFELKIEDMNFDRLIPALENNEVDFVMAGMSPTPERQAKVEFTDLYYQASSIILMPRGANINFKEDVKDKRVGVQGGSIQADAAQKITGIDLVEFDKIGEIIQEVKAKTLEAAVIESTVAERYASANPDLDFTQPFDTESSGSAIALPKGSAYTESFNQVLTEMKETGKIKELIQKWFS